MPDNSGAAGRVNIGIEVEGQLTYRRNLAAQHLMAAARFSRRVGEVEATYAGEPFGAFFDEIISYANACVMMSAAALEAYANEMYLTPQQYFPDLPAAHVNNLWDVVENNRASPLQKFQIALTSRSLAEMPKGDLPFQRAALIVEMRNAIMHFKSEWVGESGKHELLSKRLESHLDSGSAYFTNENLFPMRWMTHANTQWFVRSTIGFLNAFEAAAGLPERWDRSRLSY